MLAINQLCAERQLAKEVIVDAVETALVTAYKRNFGSGGNISAKIDADSGAARVYAEKVVSDDVKDTKLQISLEEARQIMPEAQLEDIVQVETTPRDFGRIAAQTAKQVILQRIREAERDALYSTYAEREGEIVNGTIQSIDTQMVIVNLGKAEGTLPRSEQIPGERYRLNQRIRAYVMEVEKSTRGPKIVLSRNHRNMLRRLLELEVPEIFNGAVEIKAIAREPGSRSKVAVAAMRPGVDPVGSCVGMRGTRIQGIVNELNGEKIDVVEWSADVSVFIGNALSPAQVIKVRLEDGSEGKTATVIVPDKQLSLAIGKEGQNARLAAKLTGWRIDIKSATEAAAEVFAEPATPTRLPTDMEGDLLSRAEAILAARKQESAERALELESKVEMAAFAADFSALEDTQKPAIEPAGVLSTVDALAFGFDLMEPEVAASPVEEPVEAAVEAAAATTESTEPADWAAPLAFVDAEESEEDDFGKGKGKSKSKDKSKKGVATPEFDDFGMPKRARKTGKGPRDAWED